MKVLIKNNWIQEDSGSYTAHCQRTCTLVLANMILISSSDRPPSTTYVSVVEAAALGSSVATEGSGVLGGREGLVADCVRRRPPPSACRAAERTGWAAAVGVGPNLPPGVEFEDVPAL